MAHTPLPSGPRKKRRLFRVLGIIGLAVVGLLAATYLIPVETSGTAPYRDAAPRDTEFVQISGVDIAVSHQRFTGSGQADTLFLLLHGFGASSFSWRDVVEPLSELGDVVAYDRPGFGFSERPETWSGQNPYGSEAQCGVLEALSEKYRDSHSTIVVVGHSAGGTLALDCAIHQGSPATHMVLIAPAALSGGAPSGIGLIRWVPPLNRLGPLLVRGISESGNDILAESVVDQSILTDEVLAGYRKPLTVIGWENGLWQFTLAPRREVGVAELAGVVTPSLVITGDLDQIVAPADSQTIADALPNGQFVEFGQVGHLPQEEAPADTVREIDRFLQATSR